MIPSDGSWCCRDNTNTIGWTDDLFLADVWFPSDFDAGDFPDMPVNTHLVALTWEDYCRLMEDRPRGLGYVVQSHR